MSFASPLFLYGLFALAIPVIIHLFNFRKYKVVYFSNTNLLQNINQQTKSKNKLRHLLVLLARLLALACLVLAFAQPFIPANNKKAASKDGSVAAIYIDNSFSMMAEGANGQLLEEAKKRAHGIVKGYPAGTSFVVATNDDNPESFFLMQRDKALEFIKTIAISPSPVNISKTTGVIHATANNELPGCSVSMFLVSDFQKTETDMAKLKDFPRSQFFFVMVNASIAANISIDSCWFHSPSHSLVQPEKIFISLQNYSDQTYPDLGVKVFVNDTVKAISSVSLAAHEKKTISVDYNNTSVGFKNCKVEIADYPVIYDNSYFLAYEVVSSFNVLMVSQGSANKFLETIYANENTVSLTRSNISSINYAQLGSSQLVVVDGLQEISSGMSGELTAFVSDGGCAVLCPSATSKIESYATILQPAGILVGDFAREKAVAGGIDFKHLLYRNVFKQEVRNADLPVVMERFRVDIGQRSLAKSVLWTETREPIIVSAPLGKGNVIFVSAPCSEANVSLMKHPVFVPLIMNSPSLSRQSLALDCKAGQDNVVRIKSPSSSTEVLHMVNTSGSFDEIPRQSAAPSESATRLFVGQNVRESGVYYITQGRSKIKNLSFNFNRDESSMQFFSKDELELSIEQQKLQAAIIDKPIELSGEALHTLDHGTRLWKWFIILVLVFLLAEIILVRYWQPKPKS